MTATMKNLVVPSAEFGKEATGLDVFTYNFFLSEDVVKNKIDLKLHMLCFLLDGNKEIHFSDASVIVNRSHSIILKKGNQLWTELRSPGGNYHCKLLLFTESVLKKFLSTYGGGGSNDTSTSPYFIIENCAFVSAYLQSLAVLDERNEIHQQIVMIKFQELLLFLLNKYGKSFEQYLYSLISSQSHSTFESIVEKQVESNLKLEEIAFLCNMSLSTFKRHFSKTYGDTPGNWFAHRRLKKAKELLASGQHRPSDIYHEFGYNNLSNFSAAFKRVFGISPADVKK